MRRVCASVIGRRALVTVTMRTADGDIFKLDPRSRTESPLLFAGETDTDDLAFLTGCIAEGSVVMDIGANIGLISVPLGRVIAERGGHLIAVEPVAANAERLRANLQLNQLGQVAHVEECALGATPGTLRLGRECAGGSSTGNAVAERAAVGLQSDFEWATVPMQTLDQVVQAQSLRRLDLMKIDVEGAELGVLQGGVKSISQFRPIIYGEFHAGLMPAYGSDFSDVGRLLLPLNYRALAFEGPLRLAEVPFESGRGNVVLCPAEQLGELLARIAVQRASSVAS